MAEASGGRAASVCGMPRVTLISEQKWGRVTACGGKVPMFHWPITSR
jgi:hypothetical protein